MFVNWPNRRPPFSETWSYPQHQRQLDDELQDLNWLLARPCLPKLTPLDQESPQKMFHTTWSETMLPKTKLRVPYLSDSYLPLPMISNHYYIPSEQLIDKPALTYSNMIFLAILSSPRQAMTVNQIYQWCEKHFPFYREQCQAQSWKNSLRHNLSLNKGFQRLPRVDGESGRGALWVIDPSQYQTMLEATRKNPACMDILNYQETGDRDHYSSPSSSPMFFHKATPQPKCALVNGRLVTWIIPESVHNFMNDREMRVVPQNDSDDSVGHSKQEEEDFHTMVTRLHLTREHILAEQELTQEERELMPSVEEYPNLFKEMVAMKLEHKQVKKRRRKAGAALVSFCCAPSLDHHYASHQMLLSPIANRLPCLQCQPHKFMQWFGSDLLKSPSTDEKEAENLSICSKNRDSNKSLKKRPRPGLSKQRHAGTDHTEVSAKRHKPMSWLKEKQPNKTANGNYEEDENSETFTNRNALATARLLLDVVRTPCKMVSSDKVNAESDCSSRELSPGSTAIQNFIRIFRFNDSSDESLSSPVKAGATKSTA